MWAQGRAGPAKRASHIDRNDGLSGRPATVLNVPRTSVILATALLSATGASGGEFNGPTVRASSQASFLVAPTVHSTNMARFEKWRDLLARWAREQRLAATTCAASNSVNCVPPEWQRLLKDLAQLSDREKLERVNSALNRHPYVSSYQNWGEVNYWETPFEFLRRNGQCQDYSVAKFMMLRATGFPNERLRIVIVHDDERQLDHAVLIAYVDGEALLLDNQFTSVVPAAKVRRYRPYYSINETGWWLYIAESNDRGHGARGLD